MGETTLVRPIVQAGDRILPEMADGLARQGHRVPLLDHQLGQLGRHTGEAVHQPAAGAALARGVD